MKSIYKYEFNWKVWNERKIFIQIMKINSSRWFQGWGEHMNEWINIGVTLQFHANGFCSNPLKGCTK